MIKPYVDLFIGSLTDRTVFSILVSHRTWHVLSGSLFKKCVDHTHTYTAYHAYIFYIIKEFNVSRFR